MLQDAKYDQERIDYLYKGFTEGFSLGYSGPQFRHDRSANLPFRVGNKFQLWEKIMKEVEAKRYAGPYEEIPFEYYVQSPVGLVPKDGG